MAKARRKTKPKAINVALPTPERVTGHETRREGMATRIVPTIDTLHNRQRITEAEWKALGHYAEQRCIADGSPLKDSIGRLLHISGNSRDHMPAAVLSAQQRIRYLEGELGQLRPIAEAIAYEDITLTEWVCRQGEGRIKCEIIDGAKICKPYADQRFYEFALLELRFAARRLISAIGC
jgi:hypothetical protein